MSAVDEHERELAEHDMLTDFKVMQIKLDLTLLTVRESNGEDLRQMLIDYINSNLAPILE